MARPRHPLKKAVDLAVKAYAAYEKKDHLSDQKMIEYLMKLEGRWELRRRDVAIMRKLQDKADDDRFGTTSPDIHRKLAKLKKDSGSALIAWEKELEGYEKIRRTRARHLLSIHQKTFNYIRKIYKRKHHGNRFYSVLMMGQVVAWRFVEVTHDNLTISLDEIDAMGFTLSKGEMEQRLGEIYPHLKQVVEKPTPTVNLTGVE